MNAKWLRWLSDFRVQFAICILIALLIRLPKWGEIPSGLNRDEAALGYNAYSLLKSGADEHDVPWPSTFRSFGDQKLPGYIYTLIPFIALFDLTITTVKLPSLLAGLTIIGLIGFIAKKLTEESAPKWKAFLPGLAMLFVAFSPWGNHFSRIAYEAHLAMALFLGGVATLLHARTVKNQRWWLVASAASFSATLLTYHSYQLFLPLFLLATAWLLRKELIKLDRLGMGLGVGIGLLTALILLLGGIWSSNLTKQTGISPFSKTAIEKNIRVWRNSTPSILGKIFSNRWVEAGTTFTHNYLRSFSPEFFFVSGTDHHTHNVTGIANLHLFLAPFIVAGFFWIFQQKRKLVLNLLLAWFFLALVPGSLTISPTHTIRAAASFPALELIAALGFAAVIFEHKHRRLLIGVSTLVIAFFVARTNLQYLFVSPQIDATYAHGKYHQLAHALQKYSSQANAVLTQSPSSSPYIWYIFESKYDPRKLQTTRINYEPDAEKFVHVKKIDNIEFATLQWPEVEKRAEQESLILVLRPEEFPPEKRTDSRYHFVESLTDPFGQTVYEAWSIGK